MRVLGPADADAFARLDRDTFGKDAWPPAVIAEQLASERVLAVGVDGPAGLDAGAMIGLGPDAEILTVSVRPHRRREGIARRMLSWLMAEAGKRGSERCYLEVRQGSEGARALYRGLGFRDVGMRPRYYGDEDAAVMVYEYGNAQGT